MIIGVTGSVGKTSTRLAIAAVLAKKYRVATAEKNYNNEIGLPLAILGMRHCGRSIPGWLGGLIRAKKRMVWRGSYPEILVLEYGVDRPGDMDYLLRIARPDMAVVTAIGDIPAHREFFRDAEELIEEKSKLVAALPADGTGILNHDDEDVFAMREKTKAKIVTFGAGERAEARFSHYKLFSVRDEIRGDILQGITFKISYNGSEVPVRFDGALGLPYAYAAAAAAAAGVALGINLFDISEALRAYAPPPGRMCLIRGNKHSFILDDTYNASPQSMRAAIETLAAVPGIRKIAVLGDMREIGAYTDQAHRTIGDRAAGFVDTLFCVGPAARFIADEALSRGMHPDNVFVFDDSRAAGQKLDTIIREGDVILIKGSQAVRMERVVKEIMADPGKAETLLVRQEAYWNQ